MPKKVLIVEDRTGLRFTLSETCKAKGFEVVQAANLKEARRQFDKHKSSLDIVTMDGCVDPPGDVLDTLPLIKEIRAAGFAGPILANSAENQNLRPMLDAGASHTCGKSEVLEKLLELLDCV